VYRTDERQPRVGARIFDRDSRFHLCGQPLKGYQKWDLDHVKVVINSGSLASATSARRHGNVGVVDRFTLAEKAKVVAMNKRHLGITAPKPPAARASQAVDGRRPSTPVLQLAKLYAKIDYTRRFRRESQTTETGKSITLRLCEAIWLRLTAYLRRARNALTVAIGYDPFREARRMATIVFTYHSCSPIIIPATVVAAFPAAMRARTVISANDDRVCIGSGWGGDD
jgi:hypothetical protein